MARSRSQNGTLSKRVGAKPKRKHDEDDLLKQIIEYAKLRGWRSAHFRPGMMANGRYITPGLGDFKGFPDLILVRGTRLIVAELKSATGKVSKEQAVWLEHLCDAGAVTYTWRPSDWDFIVEILT